MPKTKILLPATLLVLMGSITLVALGSSKMKSTKECTDSHGDHKCMVFNYSERKIWLSVPKMAWKDKSPEQRAARFPGKIPLDNGDRYNLSAAKAGFKPFSITYKGSQGGCTFTFSPAKPSEKTAVKGYKITSKGVGAYHDASCEINGAELVIGEDGGHINAPVAEIAD